MVEPVAARGGLTLSSTEQAGAPVAIGQSVVEIDGRAVGLVYLSHYQRGLHSDRVSWRRDLKRAPSRVQWDPERDVHLRPLAHRSLQLGLAGEAARRYADEWIVSITDITAQAREIQRLIRAGEDQAAQQLLPIERPYPAAADLLARLVPPGT